MKKINNMGLLLIIAIIVIVIVAIIFILSSGIFQNQDNNQINTNSDNNEASIHAANSSQENNSSANPAVPENPASSKNNNNFKLTIKANNPQYKSTQDILVYYTLENIDNKTILISKDTANGIEIKDAGGREIKYIGNNSGLILLNQSYELNISQKITSSFIISGKDYDLAKVGSASEGYYDTITAHIGNTTSNRVILRIIK